MSMTKKEALDLLVHGEWIYSLSTGNKEMQELCEAISVVDTALRPVTREQVEKVFPGCDFCNLADFGEFGFEITKHYAKICCALGSWRFPQNEQFLFCPKCGKPLTDKAVDMVMERLRLYMEPYKCPICYGTGIVPGGFYLSVNRYSTSTNATEMCRQCQGSGLIWGADDRYEPSFVSNNIFGEALKDD